MIISCLLSFAAPQRPVSIFPGPDFFLKTSAKPGFFWYPQISGLPGVICYIIETIKKRYGKVRKNVNNT
jgi:hypothetical protein